MRAVPVIQDPVFQKRSVFNAIERFFLSLIKDERDLPFVILCIKMTILLVASATLLFVNPYPAAWMWWINAGAHAVILGLYAGPFTLMLHNTSHRPFFKKEASALNYYIPWFLGVFVGQSPLLYFAHHIGMHHSEGNLPEDRSSTMRFQRDGVLDFSIYYFRFLFIGLIDLADYFMHTNTKKRRHFLPMVFIGESLYVAMCVGLWFISPGAVTVVFILPLILVRLAMMMGNWAQHAFVSQDQPNNDYQSSITCINTTYNRTCFNDGYHIGHHLFPNMHWTDMPGEFQKNKDLYAQNRAIVFEGIDYNQVWFFLMTKRYDVLAKHFVNINNVYASDQEIMDMLRSRTKRFDKEGLEKYAKLASS